MTGTRTQQCKSNSEGLCSCDCTENGRRIGLEDVQLTFQDRRIKIAPPESTTGIRDNLSPSCEASWRKSHIPRVGCSWMSTGKVGIQAGMMAWLVRIVERPAPPERFSQIQLVKKPCCSASADQVLILTASPDHFSLTGCGNTVNCHGSSFLTTPLATLRMIIS